MFAARKPSAIFDSRVAAAALLVCLAYYAGAQLGFRLKVASIPTSIFWLPNATMFAVFLLAPVSRWWIYALAVLPAHLAVQVPHHVPPATLSLLLPQQPRRRRAGRARRTSLLARPAAVRGISRRRACSCSSRWRRPWSCRSPTLPR